MDQPYLEIRTAVGRKQLLLGRDAISIGRHSQNKLVLTDHMVSRFHCVIERLGDGSYQIRDLGASNPTRVNGRSIKSMILSSGDTVTIGQTQMVLIFPSAADAGGAALAPAKQSAAPAPAGAVEVLTEFDLVDDEPTIDQDVPDDDGPIAIDTLMPEEGPRELDLRRLAQVGQGGAGAFNETDIALVNPRGQVVHAAGPIRGGGTREAVDLLRLLLFISLRSKASDIHLEAKGEVYQLRIRLDGVMVDITPLGNAGGVRLAALVKVMCELDPSQKSIVQEGSFSARVPAGPAVAGKDRPTRRVDYRVSFAPAVFGQKLVIRVLDPASAPARLTDLNLPPQVEQDLLSASRQDSGMILVCGPTGSGKTTSLYALLRSIDLRQRNVVTIEDPVEIQLDGVTQLPVDDEKGKTFSSLLRSVLRQDPDVILVGEIRDVETARIAMQASITGHLVLSTVHTKDSLSAVFRLLDLGVEPYLLGQGLQIVLSQRLVRLLCPRCKMAQTITSDLSVAMGSLAEGIEVVYEPRGCEKCFGTGYVGRRAVFELLTATEKFREQIVRASGPVEMQRALEDTRFRSLQQSVFELVAQGLVPPEEVDRLVGR